MVGCIVGNVGKILMSKYLLFSKITDNSQLRTHWTSCQSFNTSTLLVCWGQNKHWTDCAAGWDPEPCRFWPTPGLPVCSQPHDFKQEIHIFLTHQHKTTASNSRLSPAIDNPGPLSSHPLWPPAPPQRLCNKATIAGRRLRLFPSTVITAAPQQAEACVFSWILKAQTGFMLSPSDAEAITHG